MPHDDGYEVKGDLDEVVEILGFFDFVISGPKIYDYKSAKWN